MEKQEGLFEPTSASYVIGFMMGHPDLFYEDSCIYNLNVNDFVGEGYRLIFSLLFNMIHDNVQIITPKDVEIEAENSELSKTVFERNKCRELCEQAYSLARNGDKGLFENHYDRVKKMSLLRELQLNGFDISEFYDGTNFLAQADEKDKLNRTPTAKILHRVKEKLQIIENKNYAVAEETGIDASDGIRELYEHFKQNPEVGIPITGDILNYAVRGCRKGKMYMLSSSQGGGKTRTMVGTACDLAYPHIENGKVIIRSDLRPVLFIATEMKADEIQTLILAHISGVNEEHILLGQTTADEDKLIQVALKIMDNYKKNFRIEEIANPDITTLRARITNFVIREGIEYVFYDYIFNSPALTQEFGTSNLREDVVLMMLSNSLKEIAAQYDVFIFTASQLSGDFNKKCQRTASFLRGSKALADKIDVGIIGIRVPPDEDEAIKVIYEGRFIKPNIVMDVYKNRRGKMCDVKIFRYFDYGTCRATDLFVTDCNYQLTDYTKLVIDEEQVDINEYCRLQGSTR